jgi:uncharacterized repeat protein (TIGR03837 family)
LSHSSGAHFDGFDNRLMQHKCTRWDLFCRVVDNFGDVGVCWRLARALARSGHAVRLFIDDASALAWMAPQGQPGVTVLAWAAAEQRGIDVSDIGDVVVEAFGCDPPAAFVDGMARRSPAPVWINLEYLSAEPYVERSHGLPSPQACGLTKWFFYPGFTPRTGGLLREPDLLQQRAAFDGDAWLAAHGCARRPGERVVSLFCYDNHAVPALLQRLAEQPNDTPTLLLLTPGHAQRLVAAVPPRIRTHRLPWLTQHAYDQLLWACDLNFVRGEDSLVRALWAGAPCVWQIYPQDDGVHLAKLQAFLQQWQAPDDVAAWHHAWNAPLPPTDLPAWPDMQRWAQVWRAWRDGLALQTDLAAQLATFAAAKASG